MTSKDTILELIRERLALRKVKYHPELRKRLPDKESLVLWHDPELGSCIIDENIVLGEIDRILKDPTITNKKKAIIQRFKEAGWDTLLSEVEDIIDKMV